MENILILKEQIIARIELMKKLHKRMLIASVISAFLAGSIATLAILLVVADWS